MDAAEMMQGTTSATAPESVPRGSYDAKIRPQSSCLRSFSQLVEGSMQRWFYTLGSAVARHPLWIISLDMILVALGIACLAAFFETENRGDKLWLPAGTESGQTMLQYEEYFGTFTRPENMILETTASSINMLSKGSLLSFMDLWEEVSDITVEDQGVSYTLDDLCVTPCIVDSVLSLWDYDRAALAADSDVLATINGSGISSAQLETWIGGLEYDDAGEVVSGRAAQATFELENNFDDSSRDYSDPIAEAWEEQFINLVLDCSPGFTCFVEATRSLDDEFGAIIASDLNLVAASYLIIIVFMTLVLSGRPCLNSRILLSLGAVATVGASIGWSMGFCSLLGQFYTPLHSVLPFIILGIGVDDSFVIVNAVDQTDPRKPLPERFGEALAHAGVSVTVTSLTDFIAFAVSATTALPALSSFAIYAAFGILALYVFQCTFFLAIVVLDTKRRESRRADCLPCIRLKGKTSGEGEGEEGGGAG
jgi:Niemann-Pick C1 protein